MKKKLAVLSGALACVLLLVALLYAAVASFAFAVAEYEQTPPYGDMAVELVDYLRGARDSLSALFTQRERLHMQDVLALFEGGRALGIACGVAGLALAVAAALLGGAGALGRGLLLGLLVFAVLAAGVGLWAAVDFDGWFTAMHEMVFTNDLWLLDPADSMLIRMMPLSFFIGAVRKIGVRFALGAVLLAVCGVVMARVGRRRGTA